VDYIQPKQESYPEKVAATVMVGEVNIAEAIVAQGLARIIRHRQDDDQRSSKYDDLLAAESRAQKKGAGVHSSKDPSTIKINDVTSDANRAKQMLPFLQRAGRIDALCEFVSSGSRVKLYLPKETCVITLLLGGIDCPRLGRPEQGQASDEFGDEAYDYTKSLVMQRDVRVEIDSMDKKGNFIGQCVAVDDGNNTNLSVGLVEQGFAAVYRSRDGGNSTFVSSLNAAEERAKEKKLCRWANFVESAKIEADAAKNEPKERVVNQKKLVITEVTDELHFYGQLIENGPKLEQLTNQLRAEIEARPPVTGAYTPKVGELCVAKFSMDEEWYRAKVLSVDKKNTDSADVTVMFIDYGNKEKTKTTALATMPAGFDSLAPQAIEYALGLVQLSTDEEDNELAVDYFKSLVMGDENAQYSVNTEYKAGSLEYVTLLNSRKEDLGKLLVNQGYVSVDKARREHRLQKMLTDYMKALNLAKQSHKVMWRYGDKEQDDAAEFGFAAAARK
jgi:staphylococcal nuclease domain-containing protein 1